MNDSAIQTRKQLLPLMEKSLDDPFDPDKFLEATSKWLSYINKVSRSPDLFFAMERESASNVEMCYLAYRFLSSAMEDTPSDEPIDKSQCYGFVFQIPPTKRYASVIQLNIDSRLNLSRMIKEFTGFTGEISFSRTAAAIPVGIQDFLPYEFLLAMKESMVKEVTIPNFQISKLPSSALINVFVMAKFTLPDKCKNINYIWESICDSLTDQDNSLLNVVFDSLSPKPAKLINFGFDVFPLCYSVWGHAFNKIAQEIRIINSSQNTSPRVEFSTSDKVNSFQPFLPSTNVVAHVMNAGKDVASINLAQTSCPAMAVGWAAYAIHTLVSPFCEIGSR